MEATITYCSFCEYDALLLVLFLSFYFYRPRVVLFLFVDNVFILFEMDIL